VAVECEVDELKNRVGRHDDRLREVDARLNVAYEGLLEITDVMGGESRLLRSLFATQKADLDAQRESTRNLEQEVLRLSTALAAQSGAAQQPADVEETHEETHEEFMARARAFLAQQGTANPKNVSTAQPSPSPSPSAADDEPPSQEELRVQMRAKIGELRAKAAAATERANATTAAIARATATAAWTATASATRST
jgi:hypothetical protein